MYDEDGFPIQDRDFVPEIYKYMYSTDIDNQSIECWLDIVTGEYGLATIGLINETEQQLEQGFNIGDVFSKDSNSSHIVGAIKINE